MKLKQNNVPDAQIIQRHIDNLISQNEAIIDNWNLVSIRSYNSSREFHNSTQQTGTQQQLSSTATTTIATKKNPDNSILNTTTQVQQLASEQNSKLQPLRRFTSSNKRRFSSSSTTSLLTNPTSNTGSSSSSFNNNNNNYQQFQQIPTSSVIDSHHLSTKGTKSKLKETIERKRSYNLSKLTPRSSLRLNDNLHRAYDDSLLNLPNHQRPICLSDSSSQRLTSIDQTIAEQRQNLSILSDQARGKDIIHGHISGGEPLQLENAIQNLSIKKRDGEFHYLPHELLPESNRLLQNNNKQFPASESEITINQNLIMIDSKTSSEQESSGNNAASLPLDGQRLSLFEHQLNLENQAAILHHQQQQHMIERKLEQFRLAMALEQQQQQLLLFNNQQLAASQFGLNFPIFYTPSLYSQSQALDLKQQHQQQLQQEKSNQDFLFKLYEGQQQASSQISQTSVVSQQLVNGEAAPMQNSIPKLQYHNHQPQEVKDAASGTPTHRCETCDVSFWTEELLNYHKITQCARGKSDQSARPLAFKFSGPNNFDTSSSSSTSSNSSNSSIQSPNLKLVPPQEQQQQDPHFSSLCNLSLISANDDSILKRQLLIMQQQPVVEKANHESLPFKKRKVSVPSSMAQ